MVCTQESFESLFRHYDASVQFQYLRSFRRARIIFQRLDSAAAAHQELYNYEFNGQQIKCYYAQVGLCTAIRYTNSGTQLYSECCCCWFSLQSRFLWSYAVVLCCLVFRFSLVGLTELGQQY